MHDFHRPVVARRIADEFAQLAFVFGPDRAGEDSNVIKECANRFRLRDPVFVRIRVNAGFFGHVKLPQVKIAHRRKYAIRGGHRANGKRYPQGAYVEYVCDMLSYTYMSEVLLQLTTSQKRFYETLKTYINKNGRSPTVAEMAKRMKLSSPRSVTQYLESLEHKGLIRRWRYKERGIELVNEERGTGDAGTITIPVIASAGCDQMSVFVQRNFGDFICVDKHLLWGRPKEKIGSIRAIGNSMDEAGMRDGDYALVEVTEDLRDNDIVVAVIDNFAVIKKLTLANNAVILNPVSSDPSYKPIILRRDFKLFGKVIEIIRTPVSGELEVVPLYETPEV